VRQWAPSGCARGMALSESPRPPPAHQVRPEEPNDQGYEGEGKIAVDVLAMVEEVSVNYFVDDDHHHDDQQPNPPVRNEMPPHTGSIRFANRFVKPLPARGLLDARALSDDPRAAGSRGGI